MASPPDVFRAKSLDDVAVTTTALPVNIRSPLALTLSVPMSFQPFAATEKAAGIVSMYSVVISLSR